MTHPLNFAVKLNTYRRLKNMTIGQLAEKVGVPSDRMENLLTGEHEPRAGDVVRIERALNVFFEGADFDRVAL